MWAQADSDTQLSKKEKKIANFCSTELGARVSAGIMEQEELGNNKILFTW